MSYDAWGDAPEPERLPDDCWDATTVYAVQSAVNALILEQVYEDADKGKGISMKFLARITILRAEANLLPPELWPMYEEAKMVLGL